MKTREKILVVAFGAVAFAYAGSWLFETALQGPLENRRAAIARQKKKIKTLKTKRQEAKEAAAELAVWKAQSLPSDIGDARNQYQTWLRRLTTDLELDDLTVKTSEPQNRKGNYFLLPNSIRGRGTLAQLVSFLYEFYSANHLHKIQRLDITPKGDSLDLAIFIEALVLADADRKDLSTQKSDRLTSGSLADYQCIVERDLFSFGGSSSDATDHTYLTAVVVGANGQLEAWFTSRATDEILKLHRGEPIEIGQFHGTIIAIEGSDVLVESEDDERWLLTVGENLAQASSLPPEY